MKGQILDFSIQSNTGNISGADGNRYTFNGSDWKDKSSPNRGMTVDFEISGSQALNIFVALNYARVQSTKNKTAAGLLAIFLGGIGVHKFYLGFTGPGLVFLLVNTIGWAITWIFLFIPNIVLGIIAFIEGIIYLTKSDEEFEKLYLVERKQWF